MLKKNQSMSYEESSEMSAKTHVRCSAGRPNNTEKLNGKRAIFFMAHVVAFCGFLLWRRLRHQSVMHRNARDKNCWKNANDFFQFNVFSHSSGLQHFYSKFVISCISVWIEKQLELTVEWKFCQLRGFFEINNEIKIFTHFSCHVSHVSFSTRSTSFTS